MESKGIRKPLPAIILGIVIAVAALCAVFLPGGQGERTETKEMPRESRVGFALDTVITMTAYTDQPELLEEGLAECARYEKLLSRTVEGSDVWRINHAEGQPTEVSAETAEILREAIRVGKLSEGCFDVTIAPASMLWDFTSGEAVLPDAGALAEAAGRIDYRLIRLEDSRVTVPAGMMIDLGGIAKGYIADKVKEYLEKRGIQSAILSFGGNVVGIGTKPDGSPWRVGIQDIDAARGNSMMVVTNTGASAVTSGIYERGFEADGVWYHHILDPKTGWPVQNELASVTILSESSLEGDALSTAVFALGSEKGLALIESLEGTEAILISRDRSVTMSSGAAAYVTQ